MNMKSIIATLAFIAMLGVQSKAQTDSKNVEIGFHISQFQNDFGLGLHVISPYFLRSMVAIKAGANVQWLEHLDGDEITWTTYQNIQLGVRSRSVIVTDQIFIYGEGGILTILPNSDFSSESAVFGGYGVFGFELKPAQKFGYFIELGGVGTGARADEVAGKPIYSNGFLINVGFNVGF